MVKTSRELEIEAIDKRIAEIESDKAEILKYSEVAKAIKEMINLDCYKLAFGKTFLEDEAKVLTDRLTCDDYLQKNELEIIDGSLKVIRGVKAYLSNVISLGDTSKDKLAKCDAQISQENVYKAVVSTCMDDLSDLDERLGA